MTFDVELLGNCDVIVNKLARRLGDGWNVICTSDITQVSREISQDGMVMPVPSSGEEESSLAHSSSNGEHSRLSDVCPSESTDKSSATQTSCEVQQENMMSSTQATSSSSSQDTGSSRAMDLHVTDNSNLNSGISKVISSLSVYKDSSALTEEKKHADNSGSSEVGSRDEGAKQIHGEYKDSLETGMRDKEEEDPQKSEKESALKSQQESPQKSEQESLQKSEQEGPQKSKHETSSSVEKGDGSSDGNKERTGRHGDGDDVAV